MLDKTTLTTGVNGEYLLIAEGSLHGWLPHSQLGPGRFWPAPVQVFTRREKSQGSRRRLG